MIIDNNKETSRNQQRQLEHEDWPSLTNSSQPQLIILPKKRRMKPTNVGILTSTKFSPSSSGCWKRLGLQWKQINSDGLPLFCGRPAGHTGLQFPHEPRCRSVYNVFSHHQMKCKTEKWSFQMRQISCLNYCIKSNQLPSENHSKHTLCKLFNRKGRNIDTDI